MTNGWKNMASKQDIATRAIHAGQEPDPTTGAIMTPIYATSTYVQASPGQTKGYDYARTKNPTRTAYEKCVADGVITIPAVDEYRAKNIFDIDPVPCVQKFIYVTEPDGTETEFDAYTDVIIG